MTQTHFSFPRWPGRYVHGMSVVCPILRSSGESPIEVLDFNSHASRTPTMAKNLAGMRLGIDPEQSPRSPRFVCEPSVFPAGLVFTKEVVMSLPYYSVSALGQHKPYVGYMMTGWSGPMRWLMWSTPRRKWAWLEFIKRGKRLSMTIDSV